MNEFIELLKTVVQFVLTVSGMVCGIADVVEAYKVLMDARTPRGRHNAKGRGRHRRG